MHRIFARLCPPRMGGEHASCAQKRRDRVLSTREPESKTLQESKDLSLHLWLLTAFPTNLNGLGCLDSPGTRGLLFCFGYLCSVSMAGIIPCSLVLDGVSPRFLAHSGSIR